VAKEYEPSTERIRDGGRLNAIEYSWLNRRQHRRGGLTRSRTCSACANGLSGLSGSRSAGPAAFLLCLCRCFFFVFADDPRVTDGDGVDESDMIATGKG
jgi:hypothetical protein